MRRLERKITNSASYGIEKGIKLGGEALGYGVGAIGGMVVGLASGDITLLGGLKAGSGIGRSVGRKVGKNVGKFVGGSIRKTRDFKNLITNPFDELFNGVIRFVVNLLGFNYIFDNILSNFLIQNKGKIVVFLFSLLLVFGIFISSIFNSNLYAYSNSTYFTSYSSSNSPKGSPFGGEGREYTYITSYFNDPNYFEIFGKWHKALDVIPTSKYYGEDVAYIETKKVHLYAVCDGFARSSYDSYRAITIEIKCDDGVHKVIYTHEDATFIPFNQYVEVIRGKAIGIMGCTGKCYGAHVHFGISKNGEWVDPLIYL